MNVNRGRGYTSERGVVQGSESERTYRHEAPSSQRFRATTFEDLDEFPIRSLTVAQ